MNFTGFKIVEINGAICYKILDRVLFVSDIKLNELAEYARFLFLLLFSASSCFDEIFRPKKSLQQFWCDIASMRENFFLPVNYGTKQKNMVYSFHIVKK